MVTVRQLQQLFENPEKNISECFPPRGGKTNAAMCWNYLKIKEYEMNEEDRVLVGGGKKMIKKYIDLDLLADLYGLKYDVLIGEYIKIKVKMNDSETASELYNALKSGEVLLGYSNFMDKNEVAIFKAETDSDVKFILREGQISIIANLKYLR